MTREDFIAEKEFRFGSAFFKKEGNTITKVYRSSDRSRTIMEGHHMNIEKMGRVGFEAYVFLLGKKIVRKLRFEELELF
jgi:hypothetical protein